MKKIFHFLPLVLMTLVIGIASSCSKDTDPADTDFFTGTYKGKISYTEGEKHISDDNGTVNVIKVGDTYSFKFGSDIPDLNGVKFDKKDANTYIGIGTGFNGIIITASKLSILVIKDGKTWFADCERSNPSLKPAR